MKKKIALMVVAVMAAASVQVFAAEDTARENRADGSPQYMAYCGGGGYHCDGDGYCYRYRGNSK